MTVRILFQLLALLMPVIAVAREAVANAVEVTGPATIALVLAEQVPKRATLIIHCVHAAPAGSPIYQVSLKDAHGHIVPVGLINFFNASAPHATEKEPWRFDATAALSQLTGKPVAVEIKPISGVVGVAPTIAPGSRVTVERVELISR